MAQVQGIRKEMFMNGNHKSKKLIGSRAQAIVEFAITLPILLALLVGILEVGRMLFIYSSVTNASREASRYASTIGRDDSGYYAYKYCEGIREKANKSAFLISLSSITINYDTGPGTASIGICDQVSGEDADISVDTGHRVEVTVQADYEPMVRLIPISSRTFTSSSARTFLGLVELGSGPADTPTPVSTATPSNTPTETATPSDTPTATNTPDPAVTLASFTPLPSSTPTFTPSSTPTVTLTHTPTNTPTTTFTPTATFTPTFTSTPVPGCGNITHGPISISTNTMSMTITNPHDPITILDVQVIWNASTGAPGAGGSGSALTLQYASLDQLQFWSGTSTTGSLTIIPSTTVTIPGNNATSTIIFTFNKSYKYPGTTSITINLSTPGCESFPIQSP
jgi:Flp pilus assembly protein TadG